MRYIAIVNFREEEVSFAESFYFSHNVAQKKFPSNLFTPTATLQELQKEDSTKSSNPIAEGKNSEPQEDKENLKTNRHHDEEDKDSLPCKKQLILLEGEASDEKRLMDISWEVSDKWEEVGVALGLEYKILQSVVGSEQGSKVHMKAFYMLREWRRRFGFKATYTALAKALEDSGLVGCAQQYCYQSAHHQ